MKFWIQFHSVNLALFLIVSSAIAQPILMATNTLGETYVDPKDITIEPSGFSLVTIANIKPGGAHSSGRSVLSVEYKHSVNCVDRVEKMQRGVSFSAPWAKGEVLNTAAPIDKWEAITKGSINDVMCAAFRK